MKISYITLTATPPPRDIPYLEGLRKQGTQIHECRSTTAGWRKFRDIFRQYRATPFHDFAFVGYSGHILVPFMRLISSRPIVFNALGSLTEGIIVSRRRGGRLSWRALVCWCIDMLAFHSASLTLVESLAQKKYIIRRFFVPSRKLTVAWTGVDESKFFYDPAVPKADSFTVTFRGAFLPESGIETLIETARLLAHEPIQFRIIGTGMLRDRVQALLATFDNKNVEWIEERLPTDKLRRLLQESHVMLGQLSGHERLQRTIPHKAFESLAMQLPYLTARTPGILELLRESETCFCCNPADSRDLAKKIQEVRNNPDVRDAVARRGYELFKNKLTADHLARQLLKELQDTIFA